jgi:hypothetical protein
MQRMGKDRWRPKIWSGSQKLPGGCRMDQHACARGNAPTGNTYNAASLARRRQSHSRSRRIIFIGWRGQSGKAGFVALSGT